MTRELMIEALKKLGLKINHKNRSYVAEYTFFNFNVTVRVTIKVKETIVSITSIAGRFGSIPATSYLKEISFQHEDNPQPLKIYRLYKKLLKQVEVLDKLN